MAAAKAEVEISGCYVIQMYFTGTERWLQFASCEIGDGPDVAKAKLEYWRKKHPERKFRCVWELTRITKHVKGW